jgi:hypothetical protein
MAALIETERRLLYLNDLDWLLNCLDADSRFHAQGYEPSSIRSNPLNTPPWTSRHFEVGKPRVGAVTRGRRVRRFWLGLSGEDQTLLAAHYSHGKWPVATTECLSIFRRPIGDDQSVFMPGATLFLAYRAHITKQNDRLGKLLDACQRNTSAPVIIEAKARAVKAVTAAHEAYLKLEADEAQAWLVA